MKYKGHDYEMNRRYGIRKLTVGVCSVLLSTMFLTATGVKKVKASKKGEEDAVEVVTESPASDLQEAEVAISDNTVVELETTSEATTSEENTQISEAETNVESESVASSESAASSASTEITETSAVQSERTVSSVAAAQQEVKIDSEALKEVLAQSADAANVQSDATQSAATTTQASVAATAENSETTVIAPEVYADKEIRYVLPDQDLTDLASKFVKNAEDLQAAGMMISWESVPTVSKNQVGQEISSKLVITSQSADESGDTITNTQTIDVSFMVESMATNRTKISASLKPGFFYVSNAGNEIDSVYSNADYPYGDVQIYNPDDEHCSLIQINGLNKDNLEVNFASEVDTSQIGLYYMDIQIVDKNSSLVGNNSYILQVPYIVENLKTIDIDKTINAFKDNFNEYWDSKTYKGIARLFYEDYLEYLTLVVIPYSYIRESNDYCEIQVIRGGPTDKIKINWISDLTLENNYAFEDANLEEIAPVLKLEDGTTVVASSYEIDSISNNDGSVTITYKNVVFDDLTDETDITKRPLFFTDDSVKPTQAVKDAAASIKSSSWALEDYLTEEYSPAKFDGLTSEVQLIATPSSTTSKYLYEGTYADLKYFKLDSAPEGTTYTLFDSDGKEITGVEVGDEGTTVTMKVTLPGSAQSSYTYEVTVFSAYEANLILTPADGNYEKDYDGQPPKFVLTVQSEKELPEGMDRIELDLDDLYFFDDTDPYKLVENPIYAGSYAICLGPEKEKEIEKELGESFAPLSGALIENYIINKAQPENVKITDKNGNAIVKNYASNSISGSDFYLSIDIPGGNTSVRIPLEAIHLTVVDQDGKEVQGMPSSAETYSIKVSSSSSSNEALYAVIEDTYDTGVAKSIDLSQFLNEFTIDNAFTITPLQVSDIEVTIPNKTYNGEASSLEGASVKVSFDSYEVTVSDLTSKDYEWADSQAPVNTGTYEVKFTDSFYDKLQSAINGQVDSGNIIIDKESLSDTLVSYTIDKFIPDDGRFTSDENYHYLVEGNVAFNPVILLRDGFGHIEIANIPWTDKDFTFDYNGKETDSFSNPGLYRLIRVNDSAIESLKNYDSDNFDWNHFYEIRMGSMESALYYILSAPQDSSVHKAANNTYTIDDFKPTKMQAGETELDWPEGTQFIFMDETGNEINELQLTDDRTVVQVKAILPDNAKTELVYKTQVNPIHSANVVLSPIAGEKYDKIYDTSSVSTANTPQVMISFAVNSGVTIPDGAQNISLTPDKFSFVDDNGNVVTPTNAGSYHIILNDEGLFAIRMALGNEFEISYDPNASYVSYEIKQVPAQVDLQQGYEKTFDNTANVGNISIKLLFAGFDNDPVKEVTLGSEDYVIVGQNTVSLKSGSYDIQLTEAGRKRLKDEITGWKIDASNADYSIFDGDIVIKNAITVKTAQVEEIKFNILETSKIYDGQATAVPEFTVEVNVDGLGLINLPTNTGSLLWTAGDAPVNAGEYQLQVTDDFLTAVQKYFKENFGEGNVDVSNSSINSNFTYVIDKAKPAATISVTGNKVYNARPTLDNFNVVFNAQAPGEVPTIQWQDGDFEFVNVATSEKVTAPVEAGTYEVSLTEQCIGRIKAINADNLDWSDVEISNTGMTYTITKAPATVEVSGNQTVIYTGSSITPSGFVLNITTGTGIGNVEGSQLTANELKVIGDATELGSYEVALSDELVEQLTQTYKNYDLTFTAGTLTIVRNKDVAVTLTGNLQVEYNGQEVTINPNDFVITLANGLSYDLQDGDLQFAATGDHANAGVYLIELSDQGKQNIAAVDNEHYGYKFENSLASVTVTPQKVAAQLAGSQTASYTKNEALDLSKFSISFGDQVVTVQAGELVIEGFESGALPTEAGEYQVLMTKALLERLQAENLNYDLSLSSIENSSATYRITPIEAVVKLSGGQTITYGQLADIELSNYQVELTDEFGNIVADFILQAGDLEFISEPGDVGSYTVKLNDSALKRISEIGTNYSKWNADEIEASFTVETAPLSVTLNGGQTTTYTGSPAQLDLSNFSLTILGESVDLSGDDLEIHGNPVELGEYDVALTQKALEKLSSKYTNYDLSVIPAKLFVIRDENVSVTLTGSQEIEFTGEEITIDLSNFIVALANSQTYQLQAGDLQTVSTSPVNTGTYAIELSDQGKQNIAQLDSEHYGYQFDGQGTLTIVPKPAAVIVVGEQIAAYTRAEELHPENFAITFDDQVFTLQEGELKIEGFEVGELPTEVGEYNVVATNKLFQRLQAENPNYEFIDNSGISLMARIRLGVYIITPITASVQLTGGQTVTYGQDANIKSENYRVDLVDEFGNVIDGFELTDEDLEFVAIPSDAGNYTVKLTEKALEKIAALGGDNYSEWQAPTEQISAKFEVTKANANLVLEGKDGKVYNGQISEINLKNFTLKFENGEVLDIALEPGDLVFETTPTTAGSYTVVLTEQGLAKVAAKYTNYELAVSEVKNNYEVTKAPVNAEKTEVTHDPTTGSVTIVVDVNGEKVPINLDSSVLEWVNEAGEKVEDLSAAGTYYLKVDLEKVAELGTNFELNDEILGKLVVEKSEAEKPDIPDAPVVPNTPIVTPPSEEEEPGSDDETESNKPTIPEVNDSEISDKTDNNTSNWEEWAPEGSHEDGGVVKNAKDVVLYKNNHLTRAGRIEVDPKYWAPDGSYKVKNMVMSPNGEVISKDGHVTKRGLQILTELPQTSAQGSTKLVALGRLLAGLGIFGLAGTRKRKRRH